MYIYNAILTYGIKLEFKTMDQNDEIIIVANIVQVICNQTKILNKIGSCILKLIHQKPMFRLY